MKSIRTSSTALAYLVVAALGSGLISQPGRAGDWTSSIGVASDNVVHGLKRPGEGPSAQVHLGFVAERGWTTGASLSTVDSGEAPGPRQEINFYAAAYSQLSRDWRIVGQ